MKKKDTYLIFIILMITSWVAFGPITGNDFINFDDNLYITENNRIKSGLNPESIIWAFRSVDLFYWHPLAWLSHMLDWSMFGANASGHHFMSLILHAGSMIFLFLFLNKTTKNIWSSAFAAALFAFHPLRVESVAWAAERKDVLSMFLGMAGIYVYALYAENHKLSRYIFCLILFVLSLMAKPMMVTLPFILLLLDYWPLKRRPGKITAPLQSRNCLMVDLLKEKIPFFLLAIVYSMMTFWGQKKFGVVASIDDLSITTRILNAIISCVSYLEKIFWPADLAVFYPFERSFLLWQILISSLILMIITVTVVYTFKKFPFLFVGWGWYLVTLLPVIGFIQVASQARADRFTYLPSIGIALMLSWGMPILIKNSKIRKKVLFPSAILVLFILMVLTRQQCRYWKNSATLFGHALQVTRNNAQAQNNLGLALFAEGKLDEAISRYEKAIQITPDFLPYYNKAAAYVKKGQYQSAVEDFSRAILLKPNVAEAYYNRGTAYYQIHQYQCAIEDLNNAIRLKPAYVDAYNNRGLAYGQLGQYQRAIVDFNKVIRLQPDYLNVYNNRGLAYAQLGRYQRAIDDFDKAGALNQNNADACNNRGAVYLSQGDRETGCSEAKKACALVNCRKITLAKNKGLCR